MTNPLFPEQVPISRARADLGPLTRRIAATRSRVALTSRGTVTAVLISAAELAELDRPAARQPRSLRAGTRSHSSNGGPS